MIIYVGRRWLPIFFWRGRERLQKINLTQGPIFRQLLRFSLPMIGGNLLQQVYNLVDTLIVGQFLGAQALAAVGSAYTLMVFLTSILIGLCMGSGAFFSSDVGAGEQAQLHEDGVLSFWFIGAVAVGMYLILYPGLPGILRLLQTPPELMEMTRAYVAAVLVGLGFVFLYNFFAYLLRSLGNTTVPLVFLGISAGLNVALDLWFVIGLKMGVAGAAWATVIAQGVSGIGLGLYALKKVPALRGKWLLWNPVRFRQIVVNNVATGIQQSVMNFGILMIQGLVNSFGPAVMASFAAAVKIDTIAYMPAQEFGNAYSLFVSQNFGGKKPERIRSGTRVAFCTSAVVCAGISCLIFCFAPKLMGLFIAPEETAIIAEGVRYLRIEGAMYAGIGVLFLWYGYFRGIGRPQISLVLTVISLGTRVVLAYALAPTTALGVAAIWWAIPIGWVLADGAGLLFYRRCRQTSL